MLDPAALSHSLDRAARRGGRRRPPAVSPLKGFRGVQVSEIARVGAAAWRRQRPVLPRDSDALHELFTTAFEDGVLAIGLAAACVPDRPDEALDLAERWLPLVDDIETADALGWLLLAPAALAAREPVAKLLTACRHQRRPEARRAGVMGAMALLPTPLEGPGAAPLRERLGERHVQFTERADGVAVRAVAEAYFRDPHPHVVKAVGRLVRVWGEHDPEGADAFREAGMTHGGLPKALRLQVEKGIKKGRRLQQGS